MSSAGTITAIRLTNAGLGYSQAPTISISAPATSGIGTFTFKETVTGSISGATAVVRNWSSTSNKLVISNVSGTFVAGERVVGAASSASYKIRVVSTDITNDGYADNTDIESEADEIIDFSETNPFGMP